MKTRMKKITILYILLLPLLSICQTDSLSFTLTIQADSTLSFQTDNSELYSYLEEQIDITVERGFFPREKAIAICFISSNGTLDSTIVVSSHDHLKLEVSNALEKIESFNVLNQYANDRIKLSLIFKRWKEAGIFEIVGRVIPHYQ